MRATWLLESKTLIWSLMFSTTDVDFLDPESGLENINLKKKKASLREYVEVRLGAPVNFSL